jgi:hypothetical protein
MLDALNVDSTPGDFGRFPLLKNEGKWRFDSRRG